MPVKNSTKHVQIPKLKVNAKNARTPEQVDNDAESDLDNERSDESSPDQTADNAMDETPMKSVRRNRNTLGTRHILE